MEKIKCSHKACDWTGHILAAHLKEAHKQSPGEYLGQFPDAKITSVRGLAKLKEVAQKRAIVVSRPKEKVDAIKLFKLPKELLPENATELTVERFTEPSPLTPKVDPHYVFPENTKMLLMGLALPERNRVWIGGYSGTGKTQLVVNTCALLNHELLRLNMDAAVSRAELVGEWIVRSGNMEFQYGILPTAMKRGSTLLIDEIDSANPHTMNILRSVLEDPARLVILENGGEVINAAPSFRVVATGNTFGAGDESGLYQTTSTLSVADRQRFSIFIRHDFLPAETERKLLKGIFPDLIDDEVNRFIKVARTVRDQHKAGQIEESFSPRQLINWVEKFLLVGKEQEAAQIAFLNAYPAHTALAISEIIKSAFDATNSGV